MAPQKGKQGTKGQKQILEENKETLKFYQYMILGANAAYLVVTLTLFDLFNFFNMFMLVLTTALYIASYQFMSYMTKAKFSETGQLLDAGVDLNLVGGIAEHVKDMIILTAGTQVLSLISNYFWFLMLLAPGRGFYFLWTKVLAPYFFQQAPPPEIDEKKQKKLERKMRRH